jgi:integrase
MIACSGSQNPNVPHDLQTYFDRCYLPRKLLGKRPRTTVLYRMTMLRFGEYVGHAPTLDDLNDDSLCGYLQHRITQGRAAHTVDKERAKLVALANFAARKKHIPTFPDVPALNPAKVTPRCWGREELDMLLAACASEGGLIGAAPASLWWTALHYLFLYTGERTEAAVSIRWEWIVGNWLTIPAEFRKGGKRAASYLLPAKVAQTIALLRPYTESTGEVFALPWARGHLSGTFYRRYTNLLKRAGLPSGRRWKPQCLRRTFASYLESAGGDATDALGHSTRRVTRESYLDPTVTTQEQPGDVVAKALGL